ncbi:hypothetical protein ACQUZK_09825, partial [Streptococcus pyogenes]|uniref:hypothetical protein n=1 Tax=Streptococcus pyogenes TaxID=1314 RepID=UPI003DA0DA90
ACAEIDGFRTWPPVSELLAAWGLARFGALVGPAGFDFDRWRIDSAADRIRSLYRLDEDDAFAVASRLTVTSQACPGFVELVEAGRTSGPE